MHPRVSMPKTVYVINQLTGTEFGQVVNLSETGLLLATRTDIEVGRVYQLTLVIKEVAIKASIGVECIWAEPQNTNMVFGGFHIIDISDQDLTKLQSFINQIVVD